MARNVLTASLFPASLSLPARAAPGESLCVLVQEPAQIIAACTDRIGEPVLRDSARAYGGIDPDKGWLASDQAL